MPERDSIKRLITAASRVSALLEHYEIVQHFKRDWAVKDAHGHAFESAVERLNEILAEVEK